MRTVFYTPNNAAYTLTALQPESLAFSTSDTGFQKTIDLAGISTMQHNNQKAGDAVADLQTLLEMVKNKNACITNSGAEALFWWNPSVLYETAGTNSSQKTLNDGIACIKG